MDMLTLPFADNFGLRTVDLRTQLRSHFYDLQPAFASQLPEAEFWTDVFVNAAIGSWGGPEYDWVGPEDIDNLCECCLIENRAAAYDLFKAGRESFQLVGRLEAHREKYRASGRQPVSHVLEELVVALRVAVLFSETINRKSFVQALQALDSQFSAALPLDEIIGWFDDYRTLPTTQEMTVWYRTTIDGMREESFAPCCG